ncbi:MAG: nucleotidyltransferase domain-containing protein [Candidatus Nezhaarchaeota archaeon]|nr:nucleotidyltransferase domain-containing protein [Candidatus Nezhaarchaeota archaeon]MCX8142332.1 nucleotidyltransferase domain-containing protein [Candidatus Nezhaarchaeota archaeon]MDW8050695.1 nucleotidyltransferase domain-containing protein [Nitrososphaerota archaeon]
MSFDIYIEEGLRALRAMKSYMEIAKRVKEMALRYAPDAKIYVFGSAVEGRYTAASDIDILIATNIDREKAYQMKAAIYKEIDAPVQLHVVNTSQIQWYAKFTNKLIEV